MQLSGKACLNIDDTCPEQARVGQGAQSSQAQCAPRHAGIAIDFETNAQQSLNATHHPPSRSV